MTLSSRDGLTLYFRAESKFMFMMGEIIFEVFTFVVELFKYVGFIVIGIIGGIVISVIVTLIKERFFENPNSIKKRLTRLRYPDYDRELSYDELLWADDAAGDIFKRVSKTPQFGLLGKIVLLIGFLALCVVSVLLFGAAVAWVIQKFHETMSFSALSWFRVETLGGSSIFAMTAGAIALAWASTIFVSRILNPARYFKPFFGYHRANAPAHWKSVTYDLIRKRKITANKISISKTSNIETILRAPFQNIANLLGVSLMFLGGLSAIFLVFDINYSTVIHSDRIEHSPYLSLSTRSYEVQDVVGIERRCRIIVRTGTAYQTEARLKYELLMADGRKVTLLGRDQGASLKNQFRALDHWHNIASKHLFSPMKISSTKSKKVPPTVKGCFHNLPQKLSRYNLELIEYFDASF